MIIAKYMKGWREIQKSFNARKDAEKKEYNKRYNVALYLLLSDIALGKPVGEAFLQYGVEFLVEDEKPRIGLELKGEQQIKKYSDYVHKYLLKTAIR